MVQFRPDSGRRDTHGSTLEFDKECKEKMNYENIRII